MINRVETGRTFHAYYHPERTMPAEAQAIHGIGDAFLADKPLFADAVEALLDFLGDSPLIAHNAGFDFPFINGQLRRCGRVTISGDRMVAPPASAPQRHPGAPHPLHPFSPRFRLPSARNTDPS